MRPRRLLQQFRRVSPTMARHLSSINTPHKLDAHNTHASPRTRPHTTHQTSRHTTPSHSRSHPLHHTKLITARIPHTSRLPASQHRQSAHAYTHSRANVSTVIFHPSSVVRQSWYCGFPDVYTHFPASVTQVVSRYAPGGEAGSI